MSQAQKKGVEHDDEGITYVDITPTWAGILPVLLHLSTQDRKQSKFAQEELTKMARAADLWNAHCKAIASADIVEGR